MATMAQECEHLFHRQIRTRQFHDFIEYDQYLNKFGKYGECVRTSGELNLATGTGFTTTIHFTDGSLWVTSEFYFQNESTDEIVFERRGEIS